MDAQGRRCTEKRFLTIEHTTPHALEGPPTVENCCLLCSAHNALRARQVFGDEHVRDKIASSVREQVLSALVRLGFKREPARQAVAKVEEHAEIRAEPLLRAALAVLTPA